MNRKSNDHLFTGSCTYILLRLDSTIWGNSELHHGEWVLHETPMHKVLIDLRMVRGPLHGIARYALELARRLPSLAPAWQFSGLIPPEGLPEDLGALHPHIRLVKSKTDFLSSTEQPLLAATLMQERPHLFHATSFSVPLLWPGRLVATIHDANHLALSASATLSRNAYYRLIVAPRAKRAKALITVSKFSLGEITKHLHLSPLQFEVIANGVDASFQPVKDDSMADFRKRRGLPEKYFAALGSLKPHKNLQVLLPIADQLPAPLALLAGRGARRGLGFRENVHELSPLSDNELVRFLSGATAVMVPSMYEGFSLPVLEAMACGTPVIASDAGAHTELVGDAGILVSPTDSHGWLTAAQTILSDTSLAKQLSEKGLRRAAQFSWDVCARKTLEVYQRALED
jgi:glycosyltransferase involved in cell wall biosynthesis